MLKNSRNMKLGSGGSRKECLLVNLAAAEVRDEERNTLDDGEKTHPKMNFKKLKGSYKYFQLDNKIIFRINSPNTVPQTLRLKTQNFKFYDF